MLKTQFLTNILIMFFLKFRILTKTPTLFFECKRLMETLKDKFLLNKDGQKVLAKSVLRSKKYIIYYFSASWCTPCVALLPKIKKIYQESCKRKISLEVVYISMDTDENVMYKYYKEKHGKWYAIPFGDDTINELILRFGVTHIPYLVVVKADGTIISRNARKEIDELGVNVLVTWID